MLFFASFHKPVFLNKSSDLFSSNRASLLYYFNKFRAPRAAPKVMRQMSNSKPLKPIKHTTINPTK